MFGFGVMNGLSYIARTNKVLANFASLGLRSFDIIYKYRTYFVGMRQSYAVILEA
jgi:hypothetical protein